MKAERPGFSGQASGCGIERAVQALNLRAVPIAIDDEGLDSDQLDRALTRGLDALVITPHSQNPFGASLSQARASRLRRVLGSHDVLWSRTRTAGRWTTSP